MSKKRKKMAATVKKVIQTPGQPERAEIDIHEAEDLYKEVRVENTLTDEQGGESKLKQGDAVDVIIEKDSEGKQKNS
jgi:hypothetical protein